MNDLNTRGFLGTNLKGLGENGLIGLYRTPLSKDFHLMETGKLCIYLLIS